MLLCYQILTSNILIGKFRTVTVYACSASAATKATSAAVGTGTAASTGVVTAPTSTGSPIAYATGAANINGASFGMLVAGGAAALVRTQALLLLICPSNFFQFL